jgi:putative glutathione S-transferase
MGLLVNGQWQDQWYDTKKSGGAFVRSEAQFRHWIKTGGEFPPARGRYHLYVSLACPWASRVVIFRALKKLESAISMSVVDPFMGEEGWVFSDGPGCVLDTVNHKQRVHEIYTLADPHYTGRVTVPVLWDKERSAIVSNESSEIIRMLNSGFIGIADDTVDYYPEALRPAIDEVNALIYDNVNNGVYKCGFATTQEAYEKAFAALFTALDVLEQRLRAQRYLVGAQLTEADWRLFTTLVRFDAVYVGHFKCNLRPIADYHALSNYLRELYQIPGIAETVNLSHIKQHYYRSHPQINPTRIVPVGPALDFTAPHDRR